jgi:hypothetical protein
MTAAISSMAAAFSWVFPLIPWRKEREGAPRVPEGQSPTGDRCERTASERSKTPAPRRGDTPKKG